MLIMLKSNHRIKLWNIIINTSSYFSHTEVPNEPIKEADIKICFFFILCQRPIGVIAKLLTDE